MVPLRSLVVVNLLHAIQRPLYKVGGRLCRVVTQFILYAGLEAVGSDGHGTSPKARQGILCGALDLSETRVDVVGLAVAPRHFAASPLVRFDFHARPNIFLLTLMFDAEAHGGEPIPVGAASAVERDGCHGGAEDGTE